MNKIILILMLVIASTIVPAAYSYNGKIEVYSFKVFVDGKSQSIDWDDDDRILAYSGSTIEVQIRYKNDYSDSEIRDKSIEVKTTGTLELMDGDYESKDTTQVENKEREYISLDEMYIPTNVDEDTYDLEIEYKYSYDENISNSTHAKYITHDITEKKTFDVEIRERTTDMDEIWINISNSLVYEKARSNDLLETVIDMTDIARNYSACSVELGDLRNKDILYEEYKIKVETVNREKGEEHDKLTACIEQKKNMFSATQLNNEISNKVKAGKREQKKADDNLLLGMAGIGITYFIMKRRKEAVGGKGEGEPLTGKW